MRKSVLAAAVVLSALVSPAALAFDPDTPVDAEKEAFPITLGSDEDPTIDLAFRTAFGLPKGAGAEAARTIDERAYRFRPVAIHLLPNNVGVLLSAGSLDDAGHSEWGLNAVH